MQQAAAQQTNFKRTFGSDFIATATRTIRDSQMALNCRALSNIRALLDDLTRGPVCNRNVLPQGVRYLFEAQTDEFEVCKILSKAAATCALSLIEQLKKLNYGAAAAKKQKGCQWKWPAAAAASSSVILQHPHRLQTRGRIAVILPAGGVREPRRPARVLLNSRTAKSCRQSDGRHQSGCCRLPGGAVTCLEDFFADASVFVAYGNEKLNNADFVLDEQDEEVSEPDECSSREHAVCFFNDILHCWAANRRRLANGKAERFIALL
uniref:Uncharacterized protein n=1 Tax=Macrostomum lignano TaxID=282301 RepID=A0A1I8FMV1_9PLAT